MNQQTLSPSDEDEFFVGYLPAPRRVRSRLRRTIAALLPASISISIGIAIAQRDPGDGRWDLDHQIQATGGLSGAAASPTLQTDDRRSVLLVGEGKHAAGPLPDSTKVVVTGSPITRGGWEMLEVAKVELGDDGRAARTAERSETKCLLPS